jgi:hypothetical protein
VSGTLRGTSTRSKLLLHSSKAQHVVFRGAVSDQEAAGRLSDKSGLLGGSGELHVDLSASAPLTVNVFLALRNGRSATRRGFASVTAAGSTVRLSALAKVSLSNSRLRASGGGFKFAGSGNVSGAAFALDSYSCTAYGVSVRGYTGNLGYVANPPDVTLFLASGHNGIDVASDAWPYLADAGDFGPAIEDALDRAGYSVESYAFIDYYYATTNGRGYLDLVSTLEAARDRYVVGRAFPTRVVIVDHRHGGVRAHQAIEAVPDLPVRLLVDLDASSCDFNVGHALEPGIDPVSEWILGGGYYDDEDMVQDNVEFNLEVRSDSLCPSILIEEYDDSYNVRSDGTRRGLFYFDAYSSHSEVHDPSGSTFPVVRQWMLDRLKGE